MTTLIKVKDALRPVRDSFFVLIGYVYDSYRFIWYSGIWFSRDKNKYSYKSVKAYHRIEKSLSFSSRKTNGGIGAVYDFISLVDKRRRRRIDTPHHEIVGLNVVRDFYEQANIGSNEAEVLRNFLKGSTLKIDPSVGGGVRSGASFFLKNGQLENPENFFMSRSSVREFLDIKVEKADIQRALMLASKTPSVCNRQSWYIYHLDDKELIKSVLALQNGNNGFTEKIPCLFIITSDLKAFDTSIERYQHWVDGGMYAMALSLAFHSLGLASCCLNWSQGPLNDIRLRSLIDVEDSHTVIMMFAVGHPAENIKVCFSARDPIDDHYRHLSR